jgi:hypothetical protein
MNRVVLESCGLRGSLHGIAKVIFGEWKSVLAFVDSFGLLQTASFCELFLNGNMCAEAVNVSMPASPFSGLRS